MAWNDPGNSPGKRNPWEKRPGKPASSGLDELIRQFKKKFSSTPGNGTSGAGIGIAVLVILCLLWASTGLYQIDTGQVAVITRFGKFQRIEQAGRGVRLPWPVEDAQLVNLGEEQKNVQLRVLTSDEAFVDVAFVIKYRRADAAAWVFNVRDPDSALAELGDSAVRETFAHENLGTVLQATRQSLADQARELLQNALDARRSGVSVNGIDVIDVRVPSEVRSAQDETTKAQTEAAAVVAQAREYRANLMPLASGEAAAIKENAEAYSLQRIAEATGSTAEFMKLVPEYQKAPAALRERIYIETMEDIYSKAHTVFVDGKGNTINVAAEHPGQSAVDATETKSPPAAATSKGSR